MARVESALYNTYVEPPSDIFAVQFFLLQQPLSVYIIHNISAKDFYYHGPYYFLLEKIERKAQSSISRSSFKDWMLVCINKALTYKYIWDTSNTEHTAQSTSTDCVHDYIPARSKANTLWCKLCGDYKANDIS